MNLKSYIASILLIFVRCQIIRSLCFLSKDDTTSKLCLKNISNFVFVSHNFFRTKMSGSELNMLLIYFIIRSQAHRLLAKLTVVLFCVRKVLVSDFLSLTSVVGRGIESIIGERLIPKKKEIALH